MNLTNDDVQEILRLLDASTFDELQLSTDRFKLTLRRSSAGGWTQETETAAASRTQPGGAANGAATLAPQAAAAASAAAASPAAPGAAAASTVEGIVDIHPPIIGTFYRAPKPGAAPFVEVGSVVEKDTIIGIVETMKLMNSVHAGAAGVVAEICAANGQLVEQHHVLMRLRKP